MGISINDDLISRIDEFNSLSQRGLSDSDLDKQLTDIEQLAKNTVHRGNKPARKILKAITLFKQLRKLDPQDLKTSQLQITTKIENPSWFSWNLATRITRTIGYHTGYGKAQPSKEATIRTFSQSLIDIVEKEKKRLFSTAPMILTKQAYQDHLSKTFKKDLSPEALSTAIAHAFHLHTPELKTRDKAQMILTSIFASHGFDFSTFLKGDKAEKRFIIALLNGMYYSEYHPGKVCLKSFLFQIFAESMDPKTVEERFKGLPLDQKLSLISACMSQYREGSFVILGYLETTSPELYQLIQGLRRKYYDNEAFNSLVAVPGQSLKSIIQTLDNLTKTESAATHQAFRQLGEKLLSLPLENEKKQQLQLLLDQTYTPEQIDQFFKVFGFFDHQLPSDLQHSAETLHASSLREKIEIFQKELEKAPDKDNYISFAIQFFNHLQAFSDPTHAKLQKGMERLTFALPTNKVLSELAWLPSVAKGLSSVIEQIHTPEKFPIFIIDQSNEETFEKNRKYIETLHQDPKNRCRIVQVSKKEALALAGKLKIEKLLHTSGTDNFGFGGARNAVFFLAPVLRHAFEKGEKDVTEVLSMTDDELNTLLQTAVLGPVADAVHMGDDDLEVPEINIFSDILFAAEHADEYYVFYNSNIGRATTSVGFLPLAEALERPARVFDTTLWSSNLLPQGMAGCLSKPRLCLNLPFGGEEGYVQKIKGYENDFRRPAIHLSGRRFPQKKIAVHPIVGLRDVLEKQIPYVAQMVMMQSFVIAERLPWNDSSLDNFSSLGTLISFAKGNQKNMQMAFWETFKFKAKNNESMFEGDILESLIEMDIGQVIDSFAAKKTLVPAEVQELIEIKALYQSLQSDAKIALECIKTLYAAIADKDLRGLDMKPIIETVKQNIEVKHHVQCDKLSLTGGLFLMLNAVGNGDFSRLLPTMSL